MSCSTITKILFAVAAIGVGFSVIATTSDSHSNLTKPVLITSLATAAIGAITCALSRCCSTSRAMNPLPREEFSDPENFSTIQLYKAIALVDKPNFDHLSPRDRADAIRQWIYQHRDQLNSIQEIYLSDKNLTVIPREICWFRNLKILTLVNNRIQSLQGLQNLPALQELYLQCNQIQSIQGLQNLPALQRLYLHNNQIQSVQGLQNLPALKDSHPSQQPNPKRTRLSKLARAATALPLQQPNPNRTRLSKLARAARPRPRPQPNPKRTRLSKLARAATAPPPQQPNPKHTRISKLARAARAQPRQQPNYRII